MTTNPQKNQLIRITLEGFKSIRSLVDFEPLSITVLVGPNAAGKSNFISFFRMMSWAMSGRDQLSFHIGHQGGSRRILHDGPATTREINAELTIQTPTGESEYAFRLFHAARDSLLFADERYRFSRADLETKAIWTSLGAGHKGPRILDASASDNRTAQVIRSLLKKIVVYKFHDTSEHARVRGKWPMNDNRWLKEDGANLAPFLHRLKLNEPEYYQRIVETVQHVFPEFYDFVLEPDYGHLTLQWLENDIDELFSVLQASDGFLRIVAILTVLLQPENDLPDTLILDDPELGLNPLAIGVVGDLIIDVASHTQVILATQSMALVDCFSPEDIVIVERTGRSSEFRRLNPAELEDWNSDYSLSEILHNHVFGD